MDGQINWHHRLAKHRCLDTINEILMKLMASVNTQSIVFSWMYCTQYDKILELLLHFIQMISTKRHSIRSKGRFPRLMIPTSSTTWGGSPTPEPTAKSILSIGPSLSTGNSVMRTSSAAVFMDVEIPPAEFGDVKIIGLHSNKHTIS